MTRNKVHIGLGLLVLSMIAGRVASEEPLAEWKSWPDSELHPAKGSVCGIAVDRTTGDLFAVLKPYRAELWKSTDQGKTFVPLKGVLGGLPINSYNFCADPAGKRLACFFAYGGGMVTDDGARLTKFGTIIPAGAVPSVSIDISGVNRRCFELGVVDWEATGTACLAMTHETHGVLVLSTDRGAHVESIGKGFCTSRRNLRPSDLARRQFQNRTATQHRRRRDVDEGVRLAKDISECGLRSRGDRDHRLFWCRLFVDRKWPAGQQRPRRHVDDLGRRSRLAAPRGNSGFPAHFSERMKSTFSWWAWTESSKRPAGEQIGRRWRPIPAPIRSFRCTPVSLGIRYTISSMRRAGVSRHFHASFHPIDDRGITQLRRQANSRCGWMRATTPPRRRLRRLPPAAATVRRSIWPKNQPLMLADSGKS